MKIVRLHVDCIAYVYAYGYYYASSETSNGRTRANICRENGQTEEATDTILSHQRMNAIERVHVCCCCMCIHHEHVHIHSRDDRNVVLLVVVVVAAATTDPSQNGKCNETMRYGYVEWR